MENQRYYEFFKLKFGVESDKDLKHIKEKIYNKELSKEEYNVNYENWVNSFKYNVYKKYSSNPEHKELVDKLIMSYAAILPNKDLSGEFVAVFFDKEKEKPGCIPFQLDDNNGKLYIEI